ncbi:MAG: DUF1446 domain-containing protein [Lachnospiraceae bacterium]|nr:DUF1446 domain-containing protein [Lachnospiraceae bacterium]
MKTIRIGSGAGYAGDRLEPALELIEKGNIQYISFECLAERTIAIGQQAKLKDPTKGYNGLLEHRMTKAIPLAAKHGVKIITNMGSANPEAAAKVCAQIAKDAGLSGIKIACVLGDDLLPQIDKFMDTEVWETKRPLKELDGEIVSANAYMGVEGILKALEGGADIVITGRVSDPAIFMAPLIYEFGWALDDWDKLGKGTNIGHLLECGAQVTGGYYAEPTKKDVPGVGHVGFPIIEVNEAGEYFVTKVPEAGGMVTVDTCTEQMIYEIHDPSKYLTPDVVADFSKVTFTQVDKDKVKVEGATGREKTDTFKCSVGYRDCYIGDGEISYGGPGCVARGKLALDIVKERLELVAPNAFDELKFDIIGCNSIYWNPDFKYNEPSEVRVRVAGRAKTKAVADIIANEVEALYTNGPAGGCGAVKRTREIVSVASILVDRNLVTPTVKFFEV